jgi:hypothetical protein
MGLCLLVGERPAVFLLLAFRPRRGDASLTVTALTPFCLTSLTRLFGSTDYRPIPQGYALKGRLSFVGLIDAQVAEMLTHATSTPTGGGPNGTPILLYSGISRGYTRRLAQLGLWQFQWIRWMTTG